MPNPRWHTNTSAPTCLRHNSVNCQRCASDDRRERGQRIAEGRPVHPHPDILVSNVRHPKQLERK